MTSDVALVAGLRSEVLAALSEKERALHDGGRPGLRTGDEQALGRQLIAEALDRRAREALTVGTPVMTNDEEDDLAYGQGILYEHGAFVGYCDMTQASIGFQFGGQSYTEIVILENKKAVDNFKSGDFTLAAQASAVALKSGAAANAKYQDGVAIFTMDQSGLMYEASVGGQKFNFQGK